jgi:glycosyltransferase involved in cell wall biosynthesis
LAIRGVVDCEAIAIARTDRERHRRFRRESLGMNDEAAIALSVGRLHPSKGHAYALEAVPLLLQRVPDLHWVLLGEGNQRPALEKRAKELGVEKRVHLLGFCPDPLPYYAAADVYLRTNLFEAENLSSYQAMAMGLPVVGFDTGCETELLRKVGHGFLITPRDTEELLFMPERGRKAGMLGADYSREHLDIRQTIDAFTAVYVMLARGAKPRLAPAPTEAA